MPSYLYERWSDCLKPAVGRKCGGGVGGGEVEREKEEKREKDEQTMSDGADKEEEWGEGGSNKSAPFIHEG